MTSVINLLGPIVAGIAIAGVLLFLKRVLRVPVPGWMIPVFAALTIFGLHVSNEYTWYDRHVALLPQTIEVIQPGGVSNWYEPWTYVKPRINRFVALDRARVKRNPDLDGFVLGPVLLVQRYSPTLEVTQLADCNGKRITEVAASAQFGADGLPTDITWRNVEPGDLVFEALCKA